MKIIKLSRNKYSIIDDIDYETVSQYKWSAYNSNDGKRWYAVSNFWSNGKSKVVTMHRFILGFPKGCDIDHKDLDGLNNTRMNLRICSRGQNMSNSKKRENTSSIYKGIHQRKDTKKWVAQIRNNNVGRRIGEFLTELEAAQAYDKEAKKVHGEFARTNF